MDHPKLKASYSLCDHIRFANSSGSTIASGTWRIEGTVLGMVMQDVANGEEGIMLVRTVYPGVFIPKATGIALAVGARVYWDVADGNVNADSTNNKAVGYVIKAAVSADTEVQIVLQNAVPVS